MRDKIRVYFNFSGEVQGVGFRYKTIQLARYYGVTGWVRNEYDGTVSAEMQGLEEDIDAVIQRLGQDRYIRIGQVIRRERELQPEERDFRERY